MLEFHSMHAQSRTSRWLTALLTLCAVGVAQTTLLSASAAKSSEEQPLYAPPKKITPRARVGGDVHGTDSTDPEVKALVPAHETTLLAASTSEEQRLYTPPKKITPRARVGGDVRGTDGTDPEVKALVPDHVGLTSKETPVVNWFVSKPTTYEVIVTLRDDRSPKAFQEKSIPPPKQAGIYAINFKELGFLLEPNVQYKWYVAVIRDPNQHSNNAVAGGVIERCELTECIEPMGAKITCSFDTVVHNAKAGFWYDAMGCLCNLIDADPKNEKLRRFRASLLKEVGLNGVAEWDLRSIQQTSNK